jgi:hypothetical protein
MNFDLSALEKLQEKGTATKDKKFAPTGRTRPVRMKMLSAVFSGYSWNAAQDMCNPVLQRITALKQGRQQSGKQILAHSESQAAPAPQKVAGKTRESFGALK